ncbi:RloB family protein [uncultured Bacteroides sp.]|uniref:RloB family protein n=1 Tax=uncultured Bacteroides sp. TaxID=162156 RepID=UPI002AA92DF9|nr:RloB family protein [uncultured Bacteroides sp.]
MRMEIKNGVKHITLDDTQEHIPQNRQRRRGETPDLTRKAPTRSTLKRFLIVCEGKNTETSYFNQFRLPNVAIETVGLGYNTVSLVNKAIELYSMKSDEEKPDEVWCVFDKDDFTNQMFSKAIQLATEHKFFCAYSNQAFEYWLILHFVNHHGGPLHRNEYNEVINGHIRRFGGKYAGKGSKIVNEHFFEILQAKDPATKKSRQELAIERAKRIYNEKSTIPPGKAESVTTVFMLVEEIISN